MLAHLAPDSGLIGQNRGYVRGMKLIYASIIIPLILIGIILLKKLVFYQSVGTFSTVAISPLLFLSLLSFLSLRLYRQKISKS